MKLLERAFFEYLSGFCDIRIWDLRFNAIVFNAAVRFVLKARCLRLKI